MTRTALFPILLVEDDENDVFFFRRAFQKAAIPHPLHVVRDGQEAIHYLAHTGDYTDRQLHPAPRVVVLDLNLPVKNGLEVLQWARAEPETHHVIVIVLTSSMDVLDMHEAYAFGANAYVVKPADPIELVTLATAIREFWLVLNSPPPVVSDEVRQRSKLRQARAKSAN
jgi:CheY-like chemotaxis protein